MDPTTATLTALLAGVSAGDQTSFTQLVEAYDADLLRLAYVVCGDIDQAQEAAQIAWQRLWQNPPSLRDPERLRSWLLSVAANEARQGSRRRKRGSILERRAMVTATELADPADRITYVDLQRALEGLSPQERELLGLRFVLEWPSPQIGVHLRLSPEGVRTRLRRVLRKLREEMTDG